MKIFKISSNLKNFLKTQLHFLFMFYIFCKNNLKIYKIFFKFSQIFLKFSQIF